MEKKSNGSKSNTSYRPEGANTITPYLILKDAAKFLEFAEKGLGGTITSNTKTEDGQIMNANVKIGDSSFMVGDQMHGMEVINAMLYIYTKDSDAAFKQAVDAGGKSLREVKDEFYGHRAGAVKDKWGNTWWFATQVEQVNADELSKRAKSALEEDKKKKKPEMADV